MLAIAGSLVTVARQQPSHDERMGSLVAPLPTAFSASAAGKLSEVSVVQVPLSQKVKQMILSQQEHAVTNGALVATFAVVTINGTIVVAIAGAQAARAAAANQMEAAKPEAVAWQSPAPNEFAASTVASEQPIIVAWLQRANVAAWVAIGIQALVASPPLRYELAPPDLLPTVRPSRQFLQQIYRAGRARCPEYLSR